MTGELITQAVLDIETAFPLAITQILPITTTAIVIWDAPDDGTGQNIEPRGNTGYDTWE